MFYSITEYVCGVISFVSGYLLTLKPRDKSLKITEPTCTTEKTLQCLGEGYRALPGLQVYHVRDGTQVQGLASLATLQRRHLKASPPRRCPHYQSHGPKDHKDSKDS